MPCTLFSVLGSYACLRSQHKPYLLQHTLADNTNLQWCLLLMITYSMCDLRHLCWGMGLVPIHLDVLDPTAACKIPLETLSLCRAQSVCVWVCVWWRDGWVWNEKIHIKWIIESKQRNVIKPVKITHLWRSICLALEGAKHMCSESLTTPWRQKEW